MYTIGIPGSQPRTCTVLYHKSMPFGVCERPECRASFVHPCTYEEHYKKKRLATSSSAIKHTSDDGFCWPDGSRDAVAATPTGTGGDGASKTVSRRTLDGEVAGALARVRLQPGPGLGDDALPLPLPLPVVLAIGEEPDAAATAVARRLLDRKMVAMPKKQYQ